MTPALAVYVRARSRRGRCYELAGKGIARDEAEGWMLVHGVLQTPNLGPMPHAWLEYGDVIYDAVLDRSYQRGDYLARWRAVEQARYDRMAACQMIADAAHWGPW